MLERIIQRSFMFPPHRRSLAVLLLTAVMIAASNREARTQSSATISLAVDAREAPRNLLHARMTLSVQPGPLALAYPEWLPGEHAPTGPIVNLVGLKLSAGGKPVTWRRDAE
ncbi:MAG: hypothetical protein WD669_10735, partial [Pirellulales bacterium]